MKSKTYEKALKRSLKIWDDPVPDLDEKLFVTLYNTDIFYLGIHRLIFN
jgi:hypothetical protein